MFSMYSSSYEGKADAHILTCEACLSVWSVCECFALYLLSVTQVCGHWITALRSANFFYCLSVAQAFLILCHPPKFIHVFAPSLSLESDDICGCLPLIIVIQWNGEIAAGMKRGGGGERYVSVRKTSEPVSSYALSVQKWRWLLRNCGG